MAVVIESQPKRNKLYVGEPLEPREAISPLGPHITQKQPSVSIRDLSEWVAHSVPISQEKSVHPEDAPTSNVQPRVSQ